MHHKLKYPSLTCFGTLFHSVMVLCNWRMQNILLLGRALQLSYENAGLFLSLFGCFTLLLHEEGSHCLHHLCLMIVMYNFRTWVFLKTCFSVTLFCFQTLCSVLFSWLDTNSVLYFCSQQWAPCHAIVATPLLIAFELLLCVYLESVDGN